MLTKLLTTIVTVAFLLCGATVALEALGLIFHVGTVDTEQSAEAAMTRIEASLDPMNVPREPGADALWPLPERREAALILPRVATDLAATTPPADMDEPMATPASASETPIVVAATSDDDALAGETEAQAAPPALLGGPTEAADAAVTDSEAVAEADTVVAPAPAAPLQATTAEADDRAESDQAKPAKPAATRRTHRRMARPARTETIKAHSGPECPACTWLEAVSGSPLTLSRASLAGDSPI